jgi:deoxyadenosine/deoxycytidine kinase
MAERDYATYRSLYLTLADTLTPPDLVIYLRASVETLIQRIALRNRDYERSISPSYLENLNELYESWIQHFTLCPILTVPADDLDFVEHPRHLDLIAAKVQEKLMGKEEVIFARDEISQL